MTKMMRFPSPDGELVGKVVWKFLGSFCWMRKKFPSPDGELVGKGPLARAYLTRGARGFPSPDGELVGKVVKTRILPVSCSRFPSPDGELVGKGCLLKGAPRLG